jgi:hypothetical protein
MAAAGRESFRLIRRTVAALARHGAVKSDSIGPDEGAIVEMRNSGRLDLSTIQTVLNANRRTS